MHCLLYPGCDQEAEAGLLVISLPISRTLGIPEVSCLSLPLPGEPSGCLALPLPLGALFCLPSGSSSNSDPGLNSGSSDSQGFGISLTGLSEAPGETRDAGLEPGNSALFQPHRWLILAA